jgi:hypothetical protein
MTNKLDNNNYRQFILKIEGLTIHGRVTSSVPSYASAKSGKKGVVSKKTSYYSSILQCVSDGIIQIPDYVKKLSPNEVDLAFSGAKLGASSGNVLNYLEFIQWFVHSLTHSLTHSYLLTHSLTHSYLLTHSLTHS